MLLDELDVASVGGRLCVCVRVCMCACVYVCVCEGNKATDGINCTVPTTPLIDQGAGIKHEGPLQLHSGRFSVRL